MLMLGGALLSRVRSKAAVDEQRSLSLWRASAMACSGTSGSMPFEGRGVQGLPSRAAALRAACPGRGDLRNLASTILQLLTTRVTRGCPDLLLCVETRDAPDKILRAPRLSSCRTGNGACIDAPPATTGELQACARYRSCHAYVHEDADVYETGVPRD